MLKLFVLLAAFTATYCEEVDVRTVSETVGHMIGKNLESLGLEFDLDAVVKGLQEESQGKQPPLSEQECAQAISLLQQEKMAQITYQELQKADALSNGDQIDENTPIPAPDSPKYR